MPAAHIPVMVDDAKHAVFAIGASRIGGHMSSTHNIWAVDENSNLAPERTLEVKPLEMDDEHRPKVVQQ